MSFATPPGASPMLGMALEGVDADGERVLILANQQPELVPGFRGRVPKSVLERYHLERYRSDALLANGALPFDSVERPAKDPPDFIVTEAGVTTRLDCAVLPLEGLRGAYRLFERFRSKLLESAGSRDFSGVTGLVVLVSFGDDLTALPPRRNDDSAVEPLLDALETCHVDRGALAQFVQGLGGPLPDIGPHDAGNGVSFVVNPAPPNVLVGPFAGALGFEVVLHMPDRITESGCTDLLRRVVIDHDRPSIDHLLLSVGAPDADGARYVLEELIAAFVLDGSEPLQIETKHLSRVTVHFFSNARIDELPIQNVAQ